MSEVNENNEGLNHIDIDVSETRVETPLLPEQTLRCRTGQVGVKLSGKKKQKRLQVPLELLENATDDAGQTVHAGETVFHSFLLEESGGWDQQSINRELKRTKMAVLGVTEKEAGGPVGNVAEWSGKDVLVKFSIREGDDGRRYQDTRLMSASGKR